MTGIVVVTVLVSLLLGLPPALKWQLGVVRCAVWLAVVSPAAGLLAALAGGVIGLPPILEMVAAVSLTLGLSVAVLAYRFYRDPERHPPSLAGAILSPADGEVIYVQRSRVGVLPTSTKRGHAYRLEELTRTPLRTGEAVVVGIAMNFLDVHVNRAPIAGRISLRRHLPGSFGSLRRPDAVFKNERATTLIEGNGFQVAVVQIASRLVRQIVGFVGECDAVLAGPRCVITAGFSARWAGGLCCASLRRHGVVVCLRGPPPSRQWRWARPIHRTLLRRARVALVHTVDDEQLVRGWGARALFLPDDLADESQASAPARRPRPSIVVAGKLDPDEPVASVLTAAALLSAVEVRR